jgi:class 3 adenylate cyclase
MYKERFKNVFRLAQKLTQSMDIGEVLETIRDQAKASSPRMQEVCLLVIDAEAQYYARPLHCAVEKQRINCQLCKRGKGTVSTTLSQSSAALCFLPGIAQGQPLVDGAVPVGLSEIVMPIYQQDKPLAVLDAIARPGVSLVQKDLVMLQDLVELAGNVIKNARGHWKSAQEKLTVDRILEQLRPFVPTTVQKIVDKDPEAPDFHKKETDVSVLFLDIAGYTRISETHTKEKVNFIVEKYFSSFLDIIQSHDGDINETAGDGLMVIFDGPVEKTALSAAKAALEIRAKTLDINKELENRFQPIEVNMGINSGVASLGMNRFKGNAGTRMTFTATGPVTNLAARIASAAKHGDILVGPDTAERVKHEIGLYDKGMVKFKNVKDRVRVFSLVREGNDTEGERHE